MLISLSIVVLVSGMELVFISTRAQGNGVTVNDADYYSTDTAESPPQNLTDLVVTPRIIIEYSNWALGTGLLAPDLIPVVTVPRRVIVEYADFVSEGIMRMTPDVKRDGAVDIVDVSIVARAFGTKPGQARWNPVADLDANEWVNIVDVNMVAREFLKMQIENFNIGP
jgi:hypothetical protein